MVGVILAERSRGRDSGGGYGSVGGLWCCVGDGGGNVRDLGCGDGNDDNGMLAECVVAKDSIDTICCGGGCDEPVLVVVAAKQNLLVLG